MQNVRRVNLLFAVCFTFLLPLVVYLLGAAHFHYKTPIDNLLFTAFVCWLLLAVFVFRALPDQFNENATTAFSLGRSATVPQLQSQVEFKFLRALQDQHLSKDFRLVLSDVSFLLNPLTSDEEQWKLKSAWDYFRDILSKTDSGENNFGSVKQLFVRIPQEENEDNPIAIGIDQEVLVNFSKTNNQKIKIFFPGVHQLETVQIRI